MKKKFVILGAGYNGVYVANNHRDEKGFQHLLFAGFIDNSRTKAPPGNYPILGTEKKLPELLEQGIDQIVVTAVLDPIERLDLCHKLEEMGFHFPSYRPSVPEDAYLGKGVYVHETAIFFGYDFHIDDFSLVSAYSIIEGGTHLGKGVLIMPHSFIGRDSTIGDGTVFYPHSYCSVETKVGKHCMIGPQVRVSTILKDGTQKMRNERIL